MSRVEVTYGNATIEPDADPRSIASALRRKDVDRVSLVEVPSDRALDAVRRAIERRPEVALRVNDYDLTDLGFLAGFPGLRHLVLEKTRSKKPSLAVLRDLPELRVLYVEGHDKDFEAIGELRKLERLTLQAPRAKSLEPIAGLPALRQLEISFGGIRDLQPLTELPKLDELSLWQIRGLTSADLEPIGDLALRRLRLGRLKNVDRLTALPAKTLRELALERVPLGSFDDLRSLAALERLLCVDLRTKDEQLTPLLDLPKLKTIEIGGTKYPDEEVERLVEGFDGERVDLRGDLLVGG